jgi:hypothetical protein
MSCHPVLDLPLSDVMRSEIALPLQHILRLYTVGNLLRAWRNPKAQRNIEQIFDTPDQARHAIGVCAAWLGRPFVIASSPDVRAWWIRGTDGDSGRQAEGQTRRPTESPRLAA